MSNPKRVLIGSIRGRSIQLRDDPGLPDGQEILVTLESKTLGDDAAREALRRAAGAWSEGGDDLERFLEWNRQRRAGRGLRGNPNLRKPHSMPPVANG